MICHSFKELTILEKREFLGNITHLAQTSEVMFWIFKGLVDSEAGKQFLDGVKIKIDEEKENSPASDADHV